jgi:hypothetical protein
MTWYAMSAIIGFTIIYLLKNMYTNGFPPYVVFRLLDQYMRAMCQTEARVEETVILSMHGYNVMPKIKMVDCTSIMVYNGQHTGKDKVLVMDIMNGAREIMQGEQGSVTAIERMLVSSEALKPMIICSVSSAANPASLGSVGGG